VVLPRLGVARDLAAAGVWRKRGWRHAEADTDRMDALRRLAAMLGELEEQARVAGLSLAPVVAVGVPGVVDAEGRIRRGAANLPGDWQAEGFRLPAELAGLLRMEGDSHPAVLLHNDAVSQGLSEAPFLRDVARWGVLTVGTGLGNARFTNLPMKA
jgi:predicted NBD/HSP70 family sugar kinase